MADYNPGQRLYAFQSIRFDHLKMACLGWLGPNKELLVIFELSDGFLPI